jgi:hypothetical protein
MYRGRNQDESMYNSFTTECSLKEETKHKYEIERKNKSSKKLSGLEPR